MPDEEKDMRGPSMGYDSTDHGAVGGPVGILKARVGTVEKIKEEVLELQEAKRLGDPVNQLVELRDILGACALFLEEHFPKTDFLALARGAITMNKNRR